MNDTRPFVRITMRVEPVDTWGRPGGSPQWVTGLARLDRVDDGYPTPPMHEIHWFADAAGRYYTCSTEEPGRS